MLATHFTLSADSQPTPDDMHLRSSVYLLMKLWAQNRYSNYGNYSGMVLVGISLVMICTKGGHALIVVRWNIEL